MRKIFSVCTLLALCLAFAGCQKDAGRGGQCVMDFSLQLPADAATRAVSDGDFIDVVFYEIWDSEFANVLKSGTLPISGGVCTTSFTLVKDQYYNFIFWAQDKDVEAYSWDNNLKNIKVDYTKFTANNKDCYDAFYAPAKDVVADGSNKTVYLYRPFAQLNFGASTMTTDVGSFTIESSKVTVENVSTVFNTVDGKADPTALSQVTFSAPTGGLVQTNAEDGKELLAKGEKYYWVSMNYFLVPGETEANVNVTAVFNTTGGTVSHAIGSVPVQRNFKTNIVGDIFTSTSNFTIEVKPAFETGDKEVTVE